MLGLVRSTRYANETASPRRQRHSREAGSCSGMSEPIHYMLPLSLLIGLLRIPLRIYVKLRP